MKIFTCTDFTGHWPVGVAAVVIAEDKAIAEAQLREALAVKGLKQNPNTAIEIKEVSAPGVYILCDGNY